MRRGVAAPHSGRRILIHHLGKVPAVSAVSGAAFRRPSRVNVISGMRGVENKNDHPNHTGYEQYRKKHNKSLFGFCFAGNYRFKRLHYIMK
jgi:hypothetical protein